MTKLAAWLTPLIALTLLLALAGGCKTAERGTIGAEIRQGSVGVTVTGYELGYLDLQAESGAVQTTTDPVLLIHLSVKNYGQSPVRYDTRDAATSAQQALTPVLFVQPEGDRELSANDNVPVVTLGQYRYLADPQSGVATLPAGETVEDILLFSAPPEGTTHLQLSLPPTMFGTSEETPIWIDIEYSPTEPFTPPTHAMNELIEGDGYKFQLDTTEVNFLPNTDSTGFIEQPVFALHYTIQNTTEDEMTYRPPHRLTAGETAPALVAGSETLSRVTTSPDQGVGGQVTQAQTLAPGATLRDFIVFERPGPSISELTLYFPGHTLGRTGQLRVRVPYTFVDPPLPEALREPEPVPPVVQPTEPPPESE